MWPPSLGIGIQPDFDHPSPATPSPVPGPSTTFVARSSALPPPTGERSASLRRGREYARASKSFKSRRNSVPIASRSSLRLVAQPRFVTQIVSPTIGPATANAASFGRTLTALRYVAAADWIDA